MSRESGLDIQAIGAITLVMGTAILVFACGGSGEPAKLAASSAAPAVASQSTLQVRLSYQEFVKDPARLASLERGVKVMKSRDGASSDSVEYRTSWQYWSAMHSYYGTESMYGEVSGNQASAQPQHRHFFDSIADLTTPTVPSDVAQKVWDHCQHGTSHFFTWHRMYLYYFERVLRAAAGDMNLRLPYWDYTDPAHLDFPSDLGQPNLNGGMNALYDTRRRSQSVGLTENRTNIDKVLREPDFFVFQNEIENQPHGYVHCAVGAACSVPLMGAVPAAATDVVFWMHHANIDRIWQCWIDKGGQVPDGDFLQQSFDFVNENGELVTMTVATLLGASSPIDYTYEKVVNCGRSPALKPSDFKFRTAPTTPTAPADKLTLDSTTNVVIDSPTKTVTLRLPSSGAAFNLFKSTISVGKVPPAGGVELSLEGVSVTKAPGVLFDVYLQRKGGSERAYVGTLTFFGAGHSHGKSERTMRRLFDVTEQLRTLAGPALETNAVDVLFEATTGVVGDKLEEATKLFNKASGLRIGRIELRVVR